MVQESTRQLQSTGLKTEGLVAKLLLDTFEAVQPRHLISSLISDIKFYRDVHLLLDLLNNSKEINSSRPHFTGEQKTSILAAEAVIGIDDKSLYENEQLSNLNRYYFLPYLDEEIPYKEGVRTVVEGKRERLKSFVLEWDELCSTSGARSDGTGNLRE